MKGTVRVQVVPGLDEIAREGAEAFVAAATTGTPEAPCRVLLSGGTTPEPMYRLLASEPTRSRIDWNSVECYFGDERPVPPDDPESNYGMVKRALLEPLGLAAPKVYRIRGEATDLELSAMRYEALMRSRFGAYPPLEPSFHLAFLGLGADGHTASLFPGVSVPEDSARLFVPVWVEAVKSMRVTATYRLLRATQCVLFLVSGRNKAAAVKRTLAPQRGEEPTPASRVTAQRETVWVLDRDAAQSLPQELAR